MAVFSTARRLREVEVGTTGPTSQCSATAFAERSGRNVGPADLGIRGNRPRGAAAEHALEIACLDFAGAGALHPDVCRGKLLARLNVTNRHDARVGEIDGGLFLGQDRFAAAE